jgi:CRISPR-associated endonuclease/helicase Cas3
VQTLPAPLLDPILDVLRELVRFYGVTVVLCTATQPALDESPKFAGLPNVREIAPEPEKYFRELARVSYTSHVTTPWSWEKVAEELNQHEQVLCIVNTKKHARELFTLLGDDDTLHLSTNMCMAHRRNVLERIKQRLKNKQPCRVISTQLVEAGIDLDFPIVYRALGPLDSIVQAAGRCNREGLLDGKGRVVIFKPENMDLPKDSGYKTATLLTSSFLKDDLHEPEMFKRYFAKLYQDLINTDKNNIQSLRAYFDFPEVAKLFRLIEDNTAPVIVSYSDEVREILNEPWGRETLRKLQPYLVSVYKTRIDDLNRKALIRPAIDPEIELWEWVGVYDQKLGIVEEVGIENFIF